MGASVVQYSEDQAAAHDAVAALLQEAGINLDDQLLTAPKSGKPAAMAITGKAGSGKTLLLAELCKALQDAGADLVSGDY